jgi:uncharacterized protein YdaU (DUF1376 family)
MSHLHWMKFYIGDELSNTSHMTPAEFGSYMLLKMHYWRFGCLPTDEERLARIARVSGDQWREIMPAIGPLFEDDWRNPKLDEQRAEAEERHRKLSEAGRKGGRPRKEEKPGYKPGFSSEKARPKQPEPEPEPEPYSDSAPRSESANGAYEKNNYRDAREGGESLFTPFPKPKTVHEATRFLKARGVPDSQMERCTQRLMAGDLSPYDIEDVANGPMRGAA